MANSPNSRFHFSFLAAGPGGKQPDHVFPQLLFARMSPRRAARTRVSFFQCVPIFLSWTSSRRDKHPHTRFHFSFLSRMSTWHAAHTRVSIFFSWLACRHCEQFKLTFPSLFPGQLDHVASNPTTRFHSFSLFACQHCEQRERALPFCSMRFYLSSVDLLSTRQTVHTSVFIFLS